MAVLTHRAQNVGVVPKSDELRGAVSCYGFATPSAVWAVHMGQMKHDPTCFLVLGPNRLFGSCFIVVLLYLLRHVAVASNRGRTVAVGCCVSPRVGCAVCRSSQCALAVVHDGLLSFLARRVSFLGDSNGVLVDGGRWLLRDLLPTLAEFNGGQSTTSRPNTVLLILGSKSGNT